ncbi:MAG: YidC/Oxa1 family membrane protein insertase [Patescibacteria group bacterium]
MLTLWHDWLFVPLLNLLMILYNGPALGNLGVAVVYLTVLLRVALTPFSVISELNRYKYERLNEDIARFDKVYKDDPMARKEHIRETLRHQKINPWASALLMGFQLLMLILLYQVFVGGMSLDKLSVLYDSVSRPDIVNVNFLGLDISQPSALASFLVAFLLYIQTVRSQRAQGKAIERGDIIFRYAFPLTVFLLLWSLPSVKAIFIFTSMLFSYIVHLFQPLIVRPLSATREKKAAGHH